MSSIWGEKILNERTRETLKKLNCFCGSGFSNLFRFRWLRNTIFFKSQWDLAGAWAVIEFLPSAQFINCSAPAPEAAIFNCLQTAVLWRLEVPIYSVAEPVLFWPAPVPVFFRRLRFQLPYIVDFLSLSTTFNQHPTLLTRKNNLFLKFFFLICLNQCWNERREYSRVHHFFFLI